MVTAFAVAVVAVVLGLLLVVAGFRGALPGRRSSTPAPGTSGGRTIDNPASRLALGLAGLVAVGLLTRWPVAAFYGALSGYFLPTMILAKRRRRQAVERIDAIATWVESLRDTMAASAGVQEALVTSAKVAPPSIRREVQGLAVRLQHETLTSSLRRFAADLRHPLADMIVASLVLATSRHAGSLQNVLAITARTARDYAAMWRSVEAGRSRLYAQVRIAGGISGVVILGFILANRAFLSPFDGVGGQLALLIIGGSFFGSGVALHRLTRPVDPDRPFQGIEGWHPHAVDAAPTEIRP